MRDSSAETTKLTANRCPHCSATVAADVQAVPVQSGNPASAEGREYDHRGILLPRKTRVGGIIIPQ